MQIFSLVNYIKYKSSESSRIKKSFKKLGICIKSFHKLDLFIWQEIYTVLEIMYEKYPEASGFLKEINLEKTERGYAETHFFPSKKHTKYERSKFFDITSGICISLNKKYFQDINSFSTKMKLENLPLDCGYQYTIAHEFGHIVDIVYSVKLTTFDNPKKVSLEDITMFFQSLPSSKDIVEKIVWSLYPKKNRWQLNVLDKLSELIGCNASINTCEAFAEAFSYEYFNISNQTTNLILEEYKKRRF